MATKKRYSIYKNRIKFFSIVWMKCNRKQWVLISDRLIDNKPTSFLWGRTYRIPRDRSPGSSGWNSGSSERKWTTERGKCTTERTDGLYCAHAPRSAWNTFDTLIDDLQPRNRRAEREEYDFTQGNQHHQFELANAVEWHLRTVSKTDRGLRQAIGNWESSGELPTISTAGQIEYDNRMEQQAAEINEKDRIVKDLKSKFDELTEKMVRLNRY